MEFFSAVIHCLIIKIEPASLTGNPSNIVAVSVHFIITGSDHLTIDVAYSIDDNVRMIITAVKDFNSTQNSYHIAQTLIPYARKSDRAVRVKVADEITPAYAGKRFLGEALTAHTGDHPRVCGEKLRH